MTARFERLSIVDGTILASALAILAVFFFPNAADASSNKTSLVFEIKNFETIKIPEIPTVKMIADMVGYSETVTIADIASDAAVTEPAFTPETVEVTEVAPVTEPQVAVKAAVAPTPYNNLVPPKATGSARVYMHEPEIRAYLCPKLGDKCNTFIAILKAENGSHECTRDNRGLNRNGSIDIGLTQINWTPASPYTFEQLQDCKFNLDIAMKKYESRGFQPWAAYNSGRYKKHLPAVLAHAAVLEAQATAATQPVETTTVLIAN
jgi:hypothetical protein